jgi:DNA modification methylase
MLNTLESIQLQMPSYRQEALHEIALLDRQLEQRFKGKLRPDATLSRALVSFQANKARPVYRWYKYKEAFSAALVEHLLGRYQVTAGIVFDPFAGSGTSLFAAAGLGLDADGIELLPIGQQIIDAKQTIEQGFGPSDFDSLSHWATHRPWKHTAHPIALPELRITRGAYPPATKEAIELYLGAIEAEPEQVRRVLRFALLCVLESVSFTRKDGQYLRWDYRSGRPQGKKRFDKGIILDFDEAISTKLGEIIEDVTAAPLQPGLFSLPTKTGTLQLLAGSCLELMPGLTPNHYSALITSPPYCNRYDYTRTYALELALLGVSATELATLRQTMLSSTVENRPKALLDMNPSWHEAVTVVDNQTLLQRVLSYLEESKGAGDLNNNGIPRMVRGYFYEMACVITECAHVLRPGAPLIMVNDNVRYAGASISADLILSDVAEKLGFTVEDILILPGGKGNSSQQMGEHGRAPLRKCIYVWRKR